MKKLFSFLLALVVALGINAQKVVDNSNQKASNPNEEVGKALKRTGTVAMSIGIPCLAIGAAALICGEVLPNPTTGYTTSKTLAEQNPNLQYMSTEEYITKLEKHNGIVRAVNTVGCLTTCTGAALTIVGIPLYYYGTNLLSLSVNYTGNGASLALNF